VGYGTEGPGDLHALSAALVVPLAAKRSDPDGGRAYLQINGEDARPRR
jgi:hypothetical protein